MAASGGSHLGESIYKGSVEDFETSCDPCKDDGDVVEASGYCNKCEEYLCTPCMKVHCLPRPYRNHVVLDKHQILQSKPRKPKVKLRSEICDKHPTECLKFYCKKHDITGCGDCIILNHKACNVDYISTIAEGYNTSDGYTSIIDKVDQLQAEVRDKLTDVGQSTTNAERIIKKALTDIKEYRRKVNAHFDQTERDLEAKCDEIKTVNQRESMKIKDELKSSSQRLASTHARLTSNIDNALNLFVRRKESAAILAALENELENIEEKQLQSVEYVKNVALTSEKSSSIGLLGELQVSSSHACKRIKHIMDMVPQYKLDISVQDSTDRSGCDIRGMVHVRENIIVCTDWGNDSVKLVDIKQGKVLSRVCVIGSPWDITYISHDTLAVTITDRRKIQFLEVKNDIVSLKNVIDVNGECRGIDCIYDKLVVSYNKPPKVEIMDFHGNVMKTIQTDNVGTGLFKRPNCVVFSRDGGSIYVSDLYDHSIIKLALDGVVQASYKHSDLYEPRGMFVCLDGSVLVCSRDFVHVVSADFKKHKLLITEKNGVCRPWGISFDEDKGMLCVNSWLNGIQTYVLQR